MSDPMALDTVRRITSEIIAAAQAAAIPTYVRRRADARRLEQITYDALSRRVPEGTWGWWLRAPTSRFNAKRYVEMAVMTAHARCAWAGGLTRCDT